MSCGLRPRAPRTFLAFEVHFVEASEGQGLCEDLVLVEASAHGVNDCVPEENEIICEFDDDCFRNSMFLHATHFVSMG